MTKKDDLQREILEKVKPGTKPSHLKRSKSADDIPKVPPLPLSEVEQLKKENEQLKAEIQSTQAKLKDLHDFAKSGNTSTPTNPTQALSTLTSELKKQSDLNVLLTEQLKEKQKEIEDLRTQLEETNPNPSELSELDQSLIARHKDLKDWFTQYQKTQSLEQELAENIEQASEELISQDKTISNLRSQVSKLKQTNQSLQKDLELAHRAVAWRKSPLLSQPNSNSPNWSLALLLVSSLVLTYWGTKILIEK